MHAKQMDSYYILLPLSLFLTYIHIYVSPLTDNPMDRFKIICLKYRYLDVFTFVEAYGPQNLNIYIELIVEYVFCRRDLFLHLDLVVRKSASSIKLCFNPFVGLIWDNYNDYSGNNRAYHYFINPIKAS